MGLGSIASSLGDAFGGSDNAGLAGGIVGAAVGGYGGYVVGSALGSYVAGGPEEAAIQGLAAQQGATSAQESNLFEGDLESIFGSDLPEAMKGIGANQMMGSGIGQILASQMLEDVRRKRIFEPGPTSLDIPYVVTREGVRGI